MINNKRLRDILKNTGIISNADYDRAFGRTNWTDMWLNPVEENMNTQSKYVLFIDSEPNTSNKILYYPNLQEIVAIVNERMIKTHDVPGYDKKRHRVHCAL